MRPLLLSARRYVLEPNWSEAHYWLGLVLLQEKRFSVAIEEHRQAIALAEKEDERLLISLGHCHFEAAQFPQAVEAYRRGIRAARFDDAGYHMMLAAALHAQGDNGQACDEWNRVLWLQAGHGEDDPLTQEARSNLDAHCDQ